MNCAKKVSSEYPELFSDQQEQANDCCRFAQDAPEETAKN